MECGRGGFDAVRVHSGLPTTVPASPLLRCRHRLRGDVSDLVRHAAALVHRVSAVDEPCLGNVHRRPFYLVLGSKPTPAGLEERSRIRPPRRVDGLRQMAEWRAAVFAAFRLAMGHVAPGSCSVGGGTDSVRGFPHRTIAADSRVEGDLRRVLIGASPSWCRLRRILEPLCVRDSLLLAARAVELDAATVARFSRIDPAAQEAMDNGLDDDFLSRPDDVRQHVHYGLVGRRLVLEPTVRWSPADLRFRGRSLVRLPEGVGLSPTGMGGRDAARLFPHVDHASHGTVPSTSNSHRRDRLVYKSRREQRRDSFRNGRLSFCVAGELVVCLRERYVPRQVRHRRRSLPVLPQPLPERGHRGGGGGWSADGSGVGLAGASFGTMGARNATDEGACLHSNGKGRAPPPLVLVVGATGSG